MISLNTKKNGENHEAIDATVNRALSTLAQATPPAGMEARILTRLRQNSPDGPSTFARRIAQLNPRFGLAGALVVACLLVAIVLRPNLRPDNLRPSNLRPDHSQPAAPSVASTAAVLPSPSVHPALVKTTPETPMPPRTIPRAHRAAEAHPHSFAAPPEPLTEQERLLLAVAASHPSPEVVAALDPVQRAEATARSEQQFIASLQVHDPNASTPSGDPQ